MVRSLIEGSLFGPCFSSRTLNTEEGDSREHPVLELGVGWLWEAYAMTCWVGEGLNIGATIIRTGVLGGSLWYSYNGTIRDYG